jgi:hypothetical protein
MLSAMYLNFRVHIEYSEVENYMEEKKRKKLEKEALKKKKSKTGIDV